MNSVRILFLADSHLGLDLPLKPRVARRRRGHDFVANHEAALLAALADGVDLVVHGGDVFDRPAVAAGIARQAYMPLVRIARHGVPVFIVPGNHERGRLPHAGLVAHPNIHVFKRPRTVVAEVRGVRVALSGFPYERRDVRGSFAGLTERTGWSAQRADVRLLCIHHCVEGATVGPNDFVFTTASDVIRACDLPRDFAAVLSGHIHRHQVLTADRAGRALGTPVLYPGSIERTSTAEIGETKGYLVLEVTPDGGRGQVRWEFRTLPARPMLVKTIEAESVGDLDAELRAVIGAAPADAVLVIRVEGELTDAQLRAISSSRVRALTPDTMNVEIRATAMRYARRPTARAAPTRASENLLLDL